MFRRQFLATLAGGAAGAALMGAPFAAARAQQAPGEILNVSYDIARELFAAINPVFEEHWKKSHPAVSVKQSHAGSSRQARAILEGLQADVVTFNQVTDIDVLARGDLVAADWQKKLPNNASPWYSLPAFLVRKGNPKNVKDWPDLAGDDIKLVFPNPKTSGNARYTYLAGYADALAKNGNDHDKAKAYAKKLLGNVAVFDTGGRGATTTFVERQIGDVLITFEAEVFSIRREYGEDKFDIVIPPSSLLAEFPVAVVEKVTDRSPSRDAAPVPGRRGLAIGVSFTREFLPEEIGRMAQIEATAAAVRQAMEEARLQRPEDVHFVQIKCPLLTGPRIAEARARQQSVAAPDTYESMGFSRGASALGVALALGEITADAVCDAVVCRDYSLFSRRASTSAGIELMRNEILVMGNSDAWDGPYTIGHDVMADALDIDAVGRALARIEDAAAVKLNGHTREMIAAVLCKAEASRSGTIRGHRHVMLDDSDIHASRHARALVGGVLAGQLGDTRLFVSGGAEHQGPSGGGPLALILRH